MRLTSKTFVLSIFILTAGTATAGDPPKEFQYLEGDVTGIERNAIGTMDLESTKVLILRGPETIIEIPYAAITNSAHKVAVTFNDKEPLYKFWALGKRLMPQIPVEHVSLQFTGKDGKPASMMIEMYQPYADKIIARIERAEVRNALNRGAFWGDRVWKTKRNQDSWGGSGVMAARE